MATTDKQSGTDAPTARKGTRSGNGRKRATRASTPPADLPAAVKSAGRAASAQKRGTKSSASKRASAQTPRPASAPPPQDDGSRVATIAKVAGGVVAGAAAIGLAARAAVKKPQRPRVLGVTLPRVDSGKINPKKLDVKKAAKQLGDLAERVEHASEDVRTTSAQVKRVTKRLS
jgi:hypothetical protein